MKVTNKNNIYKKNEKEYVTLKTFHNTTNLNENKFNVLFIKTAKFLNE